jgi:hypothetical protein
MASVQRSVFGLVAGAVALALTACGQVADGGATESTTGGVEATASPSSRGGAGAASGAGAGGAAGGAGMPVPVAVPTQRERTSCGVLWGVVDPSALPADGVLVGSYNGKPFEIPAESVLAELECPSPLTEPPKLHLSFELEEEQLVFVIRDCEAFVYLPDLSAIELTMGAEATVEPSARLDASTASGHWLLRAAATPTTPEITLEFSLSAPMGSPTTICVG